MRYRLTRSKTDKRKRSQGPTVASAALVLAVSVAFVASASGVAIRLSGGPERAAAAPKLAPTGSLGVGERLATPVASPVTGDQKISEQRTSFARKRGTKALAKAVAKKNAPSIRPRVRPRVVAPAQVITVAARPSRPVVRVAKKRSMAPVSHASWRTAVCSTYGIGDGLIGNGMAGGGTLQADSMVVAHKSLPFGTRILFSYHGRTCTAVVRDRGPYVGGRTFDLGPGTQKALGFSGVGTVKYRIL